MMPPELLMWDRKEQQLRDHRKHWRSEAYPCSRQSQRYGWGMGVDGPVARPIWMEEHPYPNPYPYSYHHYPLPRWTSDIRSRAAPTGFEVWHEGYGNHGTHSYPEDSANRLVQSPPTGRFLGNKVFKASRGKKPSRVSKGSKTFHKKKDTDSSFAEAAPSLDDPERSNDVSDQDKSVDVLLTYISSPHNSHSSHTSDQSQLKELLEKNDGLDTPVDSQLKEQHEDNNALDTQVESQFKEQYEDNNALDTKVGSQLKEQHADIYGLDVPVGSSQTFERANSFDVQQGQETNTLSPCGDSDDNHVAGSSQTFERANSFDVQQGPETTTLSPCGDSDDNHVADIHAPTPTEAARPVSLEEMGRCKKRRLGWGEGLAKYEKQKTEDNYDSVPDNDMVVCTIASKFTDKCPMVNAFPECTSPTTPLAISFAPSPVTEVKQLLMDGNNEHVKANLNLSPVTEQKQSPMMDENNLHDKANLENGYLTPIASLNSEIIDLPLSDDSTSLCCDDFVTSTDRDMLLVLKEDVLKEIELIESDIDKIECELKSASEEENIHDQLSSNSNSLPVDCVLEYTLNKNEASQVTCQSSSMGSVALNKLLPANKRIFDVSSAIQNTDVMKAKLLKRKNFMRFKERVLAIKSRAFQHLWKGVVNFISKKDLHLKSQKKRMDLSFPTPNRPFWKGCSSLRSRAARHRHLIANAETINFVSNLISSSNQVKPMRKALTMPALILDENEKKARRFVSTNGLVEDPLAIEKERSVLYTWTEEEKEIFMDKLSVCGKDFTKIASFFAHKTTGDCIEFYYKNHKAEWFRRPEKKKERNYLTNDYMITSGTQCLPEDTSSEDTLITNSEDGMEIQQTDPSENGVTTPWKVLIDGTRLLLKRSVGVDLEDNESQTVSADVVSLTSEVSDSSSGENTDEMDYVDWTEEEKSIFMQAVSSDGKDFAKISGDIKTRTVEECKIFFSKVHKCASLDTAIVVCTSSWANSEGNATNCGLYDFNKNSDIQTEGHISSPDMKFSVEPVSNSLEQNNDMGIVEPVSNILEQNIDMGVVDPVSNGLEQNNDMGLVDPVSNILGQNNDMGIVDPVSNCLGQNNDMRIVDPVSNSLEQNNDMGIVDSSQISSFNGTSCKTKLDTGSGITGFHLPHGVPLLQKCNGTKQNSSMTERHKLSSQSDKDKPDESGNIKLFGQILKKPSSQQKLMSQNTRPHNRNNENQNEAAVKSYSEMHLTGNSSALGGNSALENFGGFGIPRTHNPAFYDESRIRTGFPSVKPLTKYPDAYRNQLPLLPNIGQQLPLQDIINGGNRSSVDDLSIIPGNTNRFFGYRMINSRQVLHPFALDTPPPLPEAVFHRNRLEALGVQNSARRFVGFQDYQFSDPRLNMNPAVHYPQYYMLARGAGTQRAHGGRVFHGNYYLARS